MFSSLSEIEPMMLIVPRSGYDRALGEAGASGGKLQHVTTGKSLEGSLLDGIIFSQVSLKVIGLGPEEK